MPMLYPAQLLAQNNIDGPTVVRRSAAGKAVRVGLVDEINKALPIDRVIFVKTVAYPK